MAFNRSNKDKKSEDNITTRIKNFLGIETKDEDFPPAEVNVKTEAVQPVDDKKITQTEVKQEPPEDETKAQGEAQAQEEIRDKSPVLIEFENRQKIELEDERKKLVDLTQNESFIGVVNLKKSMEKIIQKEVQLLEYASTDNKNIEEIIVLRDKIFEFYKKYLSSIEKDNIEQHLDALKKELIGIWPPKIRVEGHGANRVQVSIPNLPTIAAEYRDELNQFVEQIKQFNEVVSPKETYVLYIESQAYIKWIDDNKQTIKDKLQKIESAKKTLNEIKDSVNDPQWSVLKNTTAIKANLDNLTRKTKLICSTVASDIDKLNVAIKAFRNKCKEENDKILANYNSLLTEYNKISRQLQLDPEKATQKDLLELQTAIDDFNKRLKSAQEAMDKTIMEREVNFSRLRQKVDASMNDKLVLDLPNELLQLQNTITTSKKLIKDFTTTHQSTVEMNATNLKTAILECRASKTAELPVFVTTCQIKQESTLNGICSDLARVSRLGGYDFVIIPEIESKEDGKKEEFLTNKEKYAFVKYGTIYIKTTGDYIVRDNTGVIREGKIDTKIDTKMLDNLDQKIKQPDFRNALLQQITNAGHTQIENNIDQLASECESEVKKSLAQITELDNVIKTYDGYFKQIGEMSLLVNSTSGKCREIQINSEATPVNRIAQKSETGSTEEILPQNGLPELQMPSVLKTQNETLVQTAKELTDSTKTAIEKLDTSSDVIKTLKNYRDAFPIACKERLKFHNLITKYENSIALYYKLLSSNVSFTDAELLSRTPDISHEELSNFQKVRKNPKNFSTDELQKNVNFSNKIIAKITILNAALAADFKEIEPNENDLELININELCKKDSSSFSIKKLDHYIIKNIGEDINNLDNIKVTSSLKQKYHDFLDTLIKSDKITLEQRRSLACYLLEESKHFLAKERHKLIRFPFAKEKYSIQTETMHKVMKLLVGKDLNGKDINTYLTKLYNEKYPGEKAQTFELSRHKKLFSRK